MQGMLEGTRSQTEFQKIVKPKNIISFRVSFCRRKDYAMLLQGNGNI
jgi:hypothetical protein